jgi:hypothetical protein
VAPPEHALEPLSDNATMASGLGERQPLLRIDLRRGRPIGGIPKMDVVQGELRPVAVRLTQETASRYGFIAETPAFDTPMQ